MEVKWITMKEAMKITGKSRTSIQRYIKQGIIERKKVKMLLVNMINYHSIPTGMRENEDN